MHIYIYVYIHINTMYLSYQSIRVQYLYIFACVPVWGTGQNQVRCQENGSEKNKNTCRRRLIQRYTYFPKFCIHMTRHKKSKKKC